MQNRIVVFNLKICHFFILLTQNLINIFEFTKKKGFFIEAILQAFKWNSSRSLVLLLPLRFIGKSSDEINFLLRKKKAFLYPPYSRGLVLITSKNSEYYHKRL
jgi:hypothetical protein